MPCRVCTHSLASQVLSLDLSKYPDAPESAQDLVSPSPVPGRVSGSGGLATGSARGSGAGRQPMPYSAERRGTGTGSGGAAVTSGEHLLGKRKSPLGRAELSDQQASLTAALMGPPTGTTAAAGRRPAAAPAGTGRVGRGAVTREAIPEETEEDVEESSAS